MQQMGLPGFPKRRRKLEPPPAPSLDALASIDRSVGQKAAFVAFIKARHEGLTGDELDRRHGSGHQRLSELRRAGLIVKTGVRRKTRSGRTAEVYIATEFKPNNG
jgi:hypothetical protein